MNEAQKDFWFPAKQYGWGWGPPTKWQGWLVLAVYLGSVLTAGVYFQPKRNPLAFFVSVGITTALLIFVAALKGEKPLTWRWGKKS
jgi:hypothetical protein